MCMCFRAELGTPTSGLYWALLSWPKMQLHHLDAVIRFGHRGSQCWNGTFLLSRNGCVLSGRRWKPGASYLHRACAVVETMLFHSSLKKAEDIWCEVVSTWLTGWCEIHILALMEIIMKKLVWNFDISSFVLLRVILKNVVCSPENS